ncbi:hypothetical protein AUC61_10825 [Pseudomonas sp. S25]|uniref:PepSY-associated TM region n=1 Tax=Pseudomonas maioricensis TaxID=1766623 RepID=A0ABS9ZHL4_9PSED|nr:hypothetical protein [Pseudomonas sp. S25]
MIPGYRVRIYCFIAALFCLSGAWWAGERLYDALTLWQFDALTGPRRQSVKEHLVFDDHPARFLWYLLETLAGFIFFSGAGLAMTWGVLRGRKAFKRWH